MSSQQKMGPLHLIYAPSLISPAQHSTIKFHRMVARPRHVVRVQPPQPNTVVERSMALCENIRTRTEV